MWWKGPPWLGHNPLEWPASPAPSSATTPELKTTNDAVLHTLPQEINPMITWMERFSSHLKMIRVLGWIHRFVSNMRRNGEMQQGPLNLRELRHANETCLKLIQSHYFFDGKDPIEARMPTKLESLCPFLDENGLLRVGGRISRSRLSEQAKHPFLLPKDCHFTRMLIDYYHLTYLHPGPNLLQALVQMKYWIPSLRRLCRRRTFLCLKCYKARASYVQTHPLMSELPKSRVQGVRAFLHTGVDFAGPFQLRHSLLRKSVISKSYMCVFVCMATKAIHLEAVTDLTTNAFLACLSRFVSRRGYPERMFSDCGTNFVGTANYLQEVSRWLQSEETKRDLVTNGAHSGFSWTFNVPYGPHHGGLWEAAVKSAKTIIRKVAGDTPLTLEEWFTLYAKVESILNSRPLGLLPSTPEEDYLTPGHFLVGTHLTTPPEPTYPDVSMSRLTRWQLVQKMTEDFWKRWSAEYLTTLQSRSKWTKQCRNITVGDLVLLREDTTMPLNWPMGKILKVLPGPDGVVRVVKLRVGSSELLRPVQKLVLLRPIDESPFTD